MEKTGGGGGGRGGTIWEETSKEGVKSGFPIDGRPSERPQAAAAWTDDVAMNLDKPEAVGKVPRRSRVVKEPSPLGLTLRKTPSLLDFISYRLRGGKNGLHGGKNGLPGGSCAAAAAAAAGGEGGVRVLGRGKSTKQGSASSGVSLQTADNKLKASNFPASSLKIGKWERISRYEGDLVSKCYYAKRKLVWEVLDNGLKSKIEIQWSDICGLKASCPEDLIGMLEIEVSRAPLFFCETNPQPRKHTLWQATTDFTGGQATICRHHSLTFPEGVLTKHYEKLLQCDPRLKSLVEGIDMVGLRGVRSLLGGGVTSAYQGQHSVHELQELEHQHQHHSPPKSTDIRHEDNKGKGSDADIDVLVTYNRTLPENTVPTVPPSGAQSSVENPFATLQPSVLGNYASSNVTVQQQQLPPSDGWKGEFEVRQRHQQQSLPSDSWKGEVKVQQTTDGTVGQRITTTVLAKSEGWDRQEGCGQLDEPASAQLDFLHMGNNKGWERESGLMEQESPCSTAERETGGAILIPGEQPVSATSGFKQPISMTGVHPITSAIGGRPNVLHNHDHVYGGLDQLPAAHLQTHHSLEQGPSNSEGDEPHQPEDPMLDAEEVKHPFAEEGSRIADTEMLETLIAPPHNGPHQQFNHSPSPPPSLPACSSGSFSSNPPPLHQPIGSQQLVLGAETTSFLAPHPCDMFVARQHANMYPVPSPQVFCTPLFRGGDDRNSTPVLPVQPHLSHPPHVVADMEVMEGGHHDITMNSAVDSVNSADSVDSGNSVKCFVSNRNVQHLQRHASALEGHAGSPTGQSLQRHASIQTLGMSGCRILPVTSMSGELEQAMEHGPLSEHARLGGMMDMASSLWKSALTESSSAAMGSVRGSLLGRLPGSAPVSLRNSIPGSLLVPMPGSISCSVPSPIPPGAGLGSVCCSVPDGSVLSPASHSGLQSGPGSVNAALSASLWETHSLQRQVAPANDTATHLTDINDFMFDFLHSSETMTESATMDSIREEEDSIAAIGEIIGVDSDDDDDEDDEEFDSMNRIPSSDVLLHNVPRVASMPQFFIRDKESGVLRSSQRETHALTARS